MTHPTRKWQEDIVSKFFVYKLGGKFPDHVGAEKELLADIESLLSRQQSELREKIEGMNWVEANGNPHTETARGYNMALHDVLEVHEALHT